MTYISPTEVLPSHDAPLDEVEWLKPGSKVYQYETGYWSTPGQVFELTVERVTRTRVTTIGPGGGRRSWYSPSYGRSLQEVGTAKTYRSRYLIPAGSPLIDETIRDRRIYEARRDAVTAMEKLPKNSRWTVAEARAAAEKLLDYAAEQAAWEQENEEEQEESKHDDEED